MVQVLNFPSWWPDISRYGNLYESTTNVHLQILYMKSGTQKEFIKFSTYFTFGIAKFQASGIHLHKWVSTNTCKSHLLAN